jgi:uncharacterized membrane protein
MQKDEFLQKLEKRLASMPDSERNDILYDYDEHIRTATEKGLDEEEIVASLGTPETIAKQYRVKKYIDKAERSGSTASVFRAILATLGLGLFNIIFIMGPFMAVCAGLLAFGVLSLSVLIAGAGFIIAGIFPQIISGIDFTAMAVELQGNVTAVMLFGGVGTMCLGGLLGIGSVAITKVFLKVTIKYLRLNMSLIRSA